MRLTRAAQRAQQGNDNSTDTSDPNERAPLNEISPNESPKPDRHEAACVEELPQKTPAKKAKGKGGAKKGAKGRKQEQAPVVLEDEQQAARSSTSDTGAEYAAPPDGELQG